MALAIVYIFGVCAPTSLSTLQWFPAGQEPGLLGVVQHVKCPQKVQATKMFIYRVLQLKLVGRHVIQSHLQGLQWQLRIDVSRKAPGDAGALERVLVGSCVIFTIHINLI